MSTQTTSPAEIVIPVDLLTTLRDEIARALEMAADALHSLCRPDADSYLDKCRPDVDNYELDEVIEQLELVIAARRAFATDAAAYPVEFVSLACGCTLRDYEDRFANDRVTVDQAESWVWIVRACEELQARITYGPVAGA